MYLEGFIGKSLATKGRKSEATDILLNKITKGYIHSLDGEGSFSR
jgi:hypothetical protein